MAKRRVIIREDDFNRLSKDKKAASSFTPFTKAYFEKRATFYSLKDKKYLADQYGLNDYPSVMLGKLTHFKLHRASYVYWLVKYNDAGEMVIRAGLRQPESKVGYMTITGDDK